MKLNKRIMSVLLSCLMLAGMLSAGVYAAGTQDDPINANDKWFGYGVDCYLLNPTLAAGATDGVWYTLTVDQAGLLFLEHRNKDVDYTITMTVGGVDYVGGCIDGVLYNAPLVSLPVRYGDVATVHVTTKDAAAGTVYASMKVIAGDADDPVTVKSTGIQVSVGAGETVYYQDDSLNAVYATSYVHIAGDVTDTTFYTVARNAESGTASKKAYTDTDGDGIIETKLGGSLGSAGAPPVKPAWAIENASAADRVYTLTLVADAHECDYTATAACSTCGEEMPHVHEYDHDFDSDCNTCGANRDAELPLEIEGNSISPDVNGLAWLVKAKVEGMTVKNGTEAVYDNATVGNYKLISMGAVVSNNYSELGYVPDLDDVDGKNVADVPAQYLCEIDEETGTVTFGVRVIHIPDFAKDREIDILTYIIFEDEAGQQHTLYCNSVYAAYNWYTA